MSDIVNLRMFRKRRAREVAADAAEQARVRAGLSATVRGAAERLRAQANLRLDGHRLEHLVLEPAGCSRQERAKVLCGRSIGAAAAGAADDDAAVR